MGRRLRSRRCTRIMHIQCRVGQGLGMQGLSVFDQTLVFEGEGPAVTHTIQVGSANVTSWGSLRDELSAPNSPILKSQIWAIQEHKLHSDDERAAAEAKLTSHSFKTFFQPCDK